MTATETAPSKSRARASIDSRRDPARKQKDIAKATGDSPSQVSRILCSPDFQNVYDLLMRDAASEARSKWLDRITHRR